MIKKIRKLIIEARGENLIDSIINTFISAIRNNFELINNKLNDISGGTRNLTLNMVFDNKTDSESININNNQFLNPSNENLVLPPNEFISPLKELKKIIISLHISHYLKSGVPENQLYKNSNGVYNIDFNNNNFDIMQLELNQNLAMSLEENDIYLKKINATQNQEEKNKLRQERDSKKTFEVLFEKFVDHIKNELYNVGLHELNHGLQKHDKSIIKDKSLFSKAYLDEKENTNNFIVITTRPFKINKLSYIKSLITNIQNESDENVVDMYLNKLDAREIDAYVRSAFSLGKRKFRSDNSKSVVMHFIDTLINDVKSFWGYNIDKTIKIGIILLYLSYAAIHFPTARFSEFDQELNTSLNLRNLLKTKYGLTKLIRLILQKIN